MPQEVKIPIKVEADIKDLKDLRNEFEKIQDAMKDVARPPTVRGNDKVPVPTMRQQARMMSVSGVYGTGGANQYSGYKPSAVHGKMMAAAQEANVRTQAAAMSVQGVYGAGGSNEYSGYKPSSASGMGAMAGMAAAAEKANVRTQAAAVSVQGVYGAGGSNEYSGYKPSGVGGGAGGSAFGMGAMAGMAAAGVLLLVKALKDTLAQSKIANAFLGTLSKLLGLLIDVVLLPFVPLLIAVLVLLSSGIMLLYGVMSKLNPFSGGSGSGSAGGATLNYIALAGAIAAALVAAIIAALIGGSVGWAVLGAALIGILTYYLVLAAYAGGAALGKALQYYVMEFILWLDGAASTISAAWKTFTDWLGGIPAWAETQWKTFTDWLGGVASTVSGLWKGFMDSLTGWFTSLYNNPLIKWLSSMLGSSSTATSTSSSGQTGGLDIGSTSSKSTTSSNTFNIVGAASADANWIINSIQSALFRAGSQSPGQGSNG